MNCLLFIIHTGKYNCFEQNYENRLWTGAAGSKVLDRTAPSHIPIRTTAQNLLNTGIGNFRIHPDFRIENFHFKHEISLLHLFADHPFVSNIVIWVNICLK